MVKTKIFMMIFIFMIFLIILTLLNQTHPISILIYILLYSSLSCIYLYLYSFNPIYTIMIFLIMISGLLIIFLYFSSLISNEQNKKLPMKLSMKLNIMANLMIIQYFLLNLYIYSPYVIQETMNLNNITANPFSNIMKIYSYPFNNLSIMCILFLLFTLFLIIKMVSIKSSSLRKIN